MLLLLNKSGKSTRYNRARARGRFGSGAVSKVFPFMNAASKYLMAKLNFGGFLGLPLPPYTSNYGQDFGLITGSLLLGNRLNPAFRNTSLLQINVITAGQVQLTLDVRYKTLSVREPNWFQRLFMGWSGY